MTRIAGTGSSNRIFQGQRKDFIVMRKDTFSYTGTYTYTDDDDTEIEYDFTGCVGMMAIKKKKNDTTAVRYVSVTFDEEDYTLSVDAEDMNMDAGKYYYDLQIYDANEEMVTKLYGDFIVLQDITDFKALIEKEYTSLLTSNIEATIVPIWKIPVVVSSSILCELIEAQIYPIEALLGSSISTLMVPNYITSLLLNSIITTDMVDKYTFQSIFGSSITFTTYINYNIVMRFESSIGLLQYNSGTSEWEGVPWTK